MFKKMLIALLLIVFTFAVFTGCSNNDESSVYGKVDMFSKQDTDKANKDNTKAEINGKPVDENTVKDIENSLKNTTPKGLPNGFPTSVPFFINAEIIDAGTFGSDGYTVVYAVKDKYKKVVDFYMDNIEGLDKSGIGEEEAYFEGIDIGDVHINGLTITDADETTQVFITLRNYGEAVNGSTNSEAEEGTEEDAWDDEEEDTESIKYSAAVEVPLKKGYPKEIVPIFPDAKIIDCSMTPSGDGGFAELVLPPQSYKDAVSFYTKELGLNPENFDSELMTTETFKGEIKGWKVSVTVARLKFGSNDPSVSITVDKE